MQKKYLFQGIGMTLNDINDKNTIIPKAEIIPQQFTGLSDKNNKEIYAGDIVKTDPEHITVRLSIHGRKYDKGVVTWLREGFEVCQSGIGANRISHYVACDCCPCGLEVIGNIFENPELIKK